MQANPSLRIRTLFDCLRREDFLRLTPVICLCGWLATACPVEPEIFAVDEMVGEVAPSSAHVFMQLGPGSNAGFSFKLGFDLSSHASQHDYAFETPVQTSMTAGARLDFLLTGLGENARYYYSVAYKESEQADWVWRPERNLQTPRNPGSAFRFCVIADVHYSGLPASMREARKLRVSENVAADAPDFVITLGDMNPVSGQGAGDPVDCSLAYSGHLLGFETQADANFYYKNFAISYMEVFSHSSMILWINGNHEGLAGYLSGCPQYLYTLNARKKYIPLLDQDESNAFFGDLVWGDVHIIWLDPLAFSSYDPLERQDPTGYALGVGQRNWLQETLSGSTSKWKLIYAHTLFGGAGPDFLCPAGRNYARGNANVVYTAGTDQILIQSLMESHGVNAYFYGHDHLYSVSECNGVKYICAGYVAPANWHDCLNQAYLPWPTIVERGHVRVDVHSDHLLISYVKASLDSDNGEVLDALSIF